MKVLKVSTGSIAAVIMLSAVAFKISRWVLGSNFSKAAFFTESVDNDDGVLLEDVDSAGVTRSIMFFFFELSLVKASGKQEAILEFTHFVDPGDAGPIEIVGKSSFILYTTQSH